MTISSMGRFSSQMLTYLGTQKTVKIVSDSAANTFKYSSGTTSFPTPGSLSQSLMGASLVSGSYSLEEYNSTKCYFLSRGATQLYADTMTGIAIDVARTLQISAESLLSYWDHNGLTSLSPSVYNAFNILRDSGHQLGTTTIVDNRNSLQARQIRS